MKKLVAGLALASATVLGTGGIALAGASAYPPAADLEISDGFVEPGSPIVLRLDGCLLGEDVLFTISNAQGAVVASGTAPCTGPAGNSAPATGSATITLNAPTAEGTYTVVARGQTSGLTSTTTLTVDADADENGGNGAGNGSGSGSGSGAGSGSGSDRLPSTGNGGTPILQLGAGALVAGLGLTGVAMYRRRARLAA